jgi:cytoskeletal protein CcmA (bactofilin family)
MRGKMFSKGKSKSSKAATSAPPSIVSADLTITGNLDSKGEIQIDGVLEGDVSCARLSVGSGGHVKGAVTVETALIRSEI